MDRFTTLCSINSELGWEPSQLRWKLSQLRYKNRLLKMPPDRLPRKIFEHSKFTPGTWANDIGFVMMELGEWSNWRGNIPVNMSAVKYKLWDQYDSKWKGKIIQKSKLDFFSKLGLDPHNPSAFVLSNIEKSKRSLIARVRNGSLHLKIEKVRFDRLPRSERVCDLCKDGIEDTDHFLYECRVFAVECAKYNISQDTIFDHPYKLGNFVQEIWNKRHNHLFTLYKMLKV